MLHCAAVLGRAARMGDYTMRNAHERTPNRHPATDISADPSADQGAHCRPWTPASLSLFLFWPIAKIGALTRGRLWVTPLSFSFLDPTFLPGFIATFAVFVLPDGVNWPNR